MGLVSAALRAGTYPAISATVLSNTTMVVKVAGSVGAAAGAGFVAGWSAG